jgi:hypothetical protein
MTFTDPSGQRSPATNLFGQDQWARRGEGDARVSSLETSRAADEATLALIQTGAWTTYTVTLSGGSGNPNLGTGGSTLGRYVKVGRTVIVHAEVYFGTAGATAGGGGYTVNLPVPARTNNFFVMGTWTGYHGGSSAMAVISQNNDVNAMRATYPLTWPSGTETVVGATTPWAWSNNDNMRWIAVYEAAT